MVLEKRYSNALTPLSYIIFSIDYFFQSFCNIWVSVTPSHNYFTISPHNLALLHSTLLHSYPVPLTRDLEKRIKATEMRCFRRLLGISYNDHITNEEVRRKKIQQPIGPFDGLMTTVKICKLKWYGHVVWSKGLAN